MERLRASTANRWLQKLLRVFQFLSAVISLGFFSARLYRLLRLARDSYNRGDGAVEGILAAAVLYTVIAMILQLCLKGGASKYIRWFLVLMDILFVGGFIAVASLTRPSGGMAGQNAGDCGTQGYQAQLVPQSYRNAHNCNLPYATFILAIISTILHALTAAFHEVRDHHKMHKEEYKKHQEEEANLHNASYK